MAWETLKDILDEARAEAAAEKERRPAACPNDGEPLVEGEDGVLFCPFDWWTWPAEVILPGAD